MMQVDRLPVSSFAQSRLARDDAVYGGPNPAVVAVHLDNAALCTGFASISYASAQLILSWRWVQEKVCTMNIMHTMASEANAVIANSAALHTLPLPE